MRKKIPKFSTKPAPNKFVDQNESEIVVQRFCLNHNGRKTNVLIDRFDRHGKPVKGFMFRQAIKHNYGMQISNCKSAHRFFVKFPLDIVFCDKHGFVVSIFPNFNKRLTGSQHNLNA